MPTLDRACCTGPLTDDDGSIGAYLLRIRDAEGKALPDERLLPHIGMFFFAGKLVCFSCAIEVCGCQVVAPCLPTPANSYARERYDRSDLENMFFSAGFDTTGHTMAWTL